MFKIWMFDWSTTGFDFSSFSPRVTKRRKLFTCRTLSLSRWSSSWLSTFSDDYRCQWSIVHENWHVFVFIVDDICIFLKNNYDFQDQIIIVFFSLSTKLFIDKLKTIFAVVVVVEFSALEIKSESERERN